MIRRFQSLFGPLRRSLRPRARTTSSLTHTPPFLTIPHARAAPHTQTTPPVAPSAEHCTTPEDVLGYWFGGDEKEQEARHWFGLQETDDEIRAKFEATWEALSTDNELVEQWKAGGPKSVLALVIVWDQFSRVLWRGDGKSFSQDHRSGALVKQILQNTANLDDLYTKSEQVFLLMPLQHSEDLEVQMFNVSLDDNEHAVGHYKVIKRFGRFPKRNAALGRKSTAEEIAYLESDEAQGRPY